jgi:Uma2 family endonuclease
LGWLINLQDQQVEIYRPGQAVEIQSVSSLLIWRNHSARAFAGVALSKKDHGANTA